MAIGVNTNESSVAVKVETTEGTYNAPTAGTDYLEVLSDGLELNKTREELVRDNLSSTVESEASRVGIADVTGTIPVELRASDTAGSAPQMLDVLMQSCLGGKRNAATQTSDTGHTSTVINFAGAPNFSVGDVVMVKEAGAFELRPVSAVGATSITFPFALENGAPSDAVVIEAVTTYYHDTTNAVTFSAEHNIGGEIQQQAAGLRAASFSIENWQTGQIPSVSASVQGLSLERADSGATASPDFTADALPPTALQACLFINGVKKSYNELGLNVENTISYIPDACDADGRIGSRITAQTVTFNANPYLDDTDLTEWNSFNDNDDVSIFFFAYNPTSTSGEFENAIAVWMPQGKITEIPVGDLDGIATNDLVVKAHRSSGNDSVFMSFS